MTAPIERIGVCSWSLRPGSPAELAKTVLGLSIPRVQLALNPVAQDPGVWGHAVGELRDAGVVVISGMFSTIGEDYSTLETIRKTGGIVPDEHWEKNLALATAVAGIAQRGKIDTVTTHAGFVPHDRQDPGYAVLCERMGTLAGLFEDAGCSLLLETGQETADDMLDFLSAIGRPNLGVNFDPANMILYDHGDPVEAIDQLAGLAHSIHIKDAVRTRTPGRWGQEVPVGGGEVDWARFFSVLADAGYGGYFVIEREAGEDRPCDIAAARDLVLNHLRGA